MRSMNGWPASLEVALGFIEPPDEHRLFASKIEHDRDRAVSSGLNDGRPHLRRVFIKIVLGEGQFLCLKQVFQGTAIASEMTRVDQKIRLACRCVVENHRFRHGFSLRAGVFNPNAVSR